MIDLLASGIISCSDSIRIIDRLLTNTVGLSHQQKIELIQVISQHTSFCPTEIISNERPKSY